MDKIKSKIHCPTGSDDCKVSVERETERLKRREQRKLIREIQENLRASFEIDGIRVTDAQFEQMIAAAKYLEDSEINL